MINDAYDAFIEAVKYLIKTKEYGSQKEIAPQVGITPQHLNAFINKRGNKRASHVLQERLAAFFGRSYESMLLIGRAKKNGFDPSEWAKIQPPTQIEDGAFIPPDILDAVKDPAMQAIVRAAMKLKAGHGD